MVADEMEMSVDGAREDTHQHGSVLEYLNNFGYGGVRLIVGDDEVHAGTQIDAGGCGAKVRMRQPAFVRPVVVDP